VLKVLEHGGIHPEAADDLDVPPAASVRSHGNACRSGIGDEMLSSARKSGPDHLFHRQQRQDGQSGNAAPGTDAMMMRAGIRATSPMALPVAS
jgi:hypothetical protein